MSYHTLRLTHLKPVNKGYDSAFHPATLPKGDLRLARALDQFDNVYYIMLIKFENQHGAAVVHDPQLRRTCVQILPEIDRFVEEGCVVTRHPPLCRKCWTSEEEIGVIINHYRVNLQDEPVLPLGDADSTVSPELEMLFETSNQKDLLGKVPTPDLIDHMVRKHGGPN